MLLNKNIVKKMTSTVGIKRQSSVVPELIDKIAREYLILLLQRLLIIIQFVARKTITIADLHFLPKICGDYSKFVFPLDVKNFNNFTLKKPFKKFVRRNLPNDIRLEVDSVPMLQTICERYILLILESASVFLGDKETLDVKHIENALKILTKKQ